MKKNLYIHHHLGLGDHFDCNGMVRYISEQKLFSKIFVFCKDSNLDLINKMYIDNSNILLIPIKGDSNLYGKFDYNEYSQVKKIVGEEINVFSSFSEIYNFNGGKNHSLLVVGHDFYRETKGKNCWEIFYDQVGLPYKIRKDYFYVGRNKNEESRVFNKLNPNRKPFIFVHEDKDRGFVLDKTNIENKDFHIIENDTSENIFHFIGILEKAKEVHCMESSFKTLIDVYCKQDKLFFHDFRGHPLGSQSNKKWKTIKY